ncbi:uncharacterized protein AB9W97_002681 isoform 2-T2 [Spinachia spinachia]
MNPADSDHLKAAICSQGTRLNQQEDQLLASSQEDFKAGMTTQLSSGELPLRVTQRNPCSWDRLGWSPKNGDAACRKEGVSTAENKGT